MNEAVFWGQIWVWSDEVKVIVDTRSDNLQQSIFSSRHIKTATLFRWSDNIKLASACEVSAHGSGFVELL